MRHFLPSRGYTGLQGRMSRRHRAAAHGFCGAAFPAVQELHVGGHHGDVPGDHGGVAVYDDSVRPGLSLLLQFSCDGLFCT